MKLFSYVYVGMDFYNNKITFLDKDCNKSEYKYNIDMSLDLLQRIKELIRLTIKEIPFSLVKLKNNNFIIW